MCAYRRSRHARAVVVNNNHPVDDREPYRSRAGIAGILHQLSDPDIVFIAIAAGFNEAEVEKLPHMFGLVARGAPDDGSGDFGHVAIIACVIAGVDSAAALS